MADYIYAVNGFTRRNAFGRIVGVRNPPAPLGRALEVYVASGHMQQSDTVISFPGGSNFYIAGEVLGNGQVRPKRFNSGARVELSSAGVDVDYGIDMVMADDGRFFVEPEILTSHGEELVRAIRQHAPELYRAFTKRAA